MEKRVMMDEVFSVVSVLKRAYMELQAAHAPYDQEKLHAADRAVVAELRRLSDLKRGFREKSAKTNPPLQKEEEAVAEKLRAEMDQMKEELAWSTSVKEKLEREVKTLRKRLPLSNGSFFPLEKDGVTAAAVEKLRAEIASKDAEMDRMKGELAQSSLIKDKLEQEVRTLQKRLLPSNGSFPLNKDKETAVVERLQAEIVAKDAEMEWMKDGFAQSASIKDKLEQEVKTLRKRLPMSPLPSLNGSLPLKKEEEIAVCTKLQVEIAAKDAKIDRMKDELVQSSSIKDQLEQEVRTLRKRLPLLNGSLPLGKEEEMLAFKNLRAEITAKDVEIDRMWAEIAAKDVEIDRMKEELVQSSSVKDELEREMNTLQKRLLMPPSSNGSLPLEKEEEVMAVEKLRVEIAAKDVEMGRMKEELAQSSMVKDKLEQEVRMLRKGLPMSPSNGSLHLEKEEETAGVEKLRAEIAVKDAELDRMKGELAQSSSVKDKLKQEVEMLRDRLPMSLSPSWNGSLPPEKKEEIVAVGKPQAEIVAKNAELDRVKGELAQSSSAKDKPEWKVNRLWKRLPMLPSPPLLSLSNGSLPVATSHFEAIVHEAYGEVRAFAILLASRMEEAGWDLGAAATSIEPGIVTPEGRLYAFESYVVHKAMDGFEDESFRLGGQRASPSSPLNFYTEFQELQVADPAGLVASCPDGPFGRFCRDKFLTLVHPQMESAFFGSLEAHRNLLQCGKHPHTSFYQSFLKLAKVVCLIHRLAFAFDVPANIFQVQRGTPFLPLYMESVAVSSTDESEGGSSPDRQKVGFTVFPGFRLQDTIIKCKVYIVYPTTES